MSRVLSNQRSANGILLVLFSVICLSIVPALIKVALAAAIDPILLLTLRMLVATAILWVVFALFWPDKLRIDRRGLLSCGSVAAANTGALLCYYTALTHVSASVTHVIFSLYPVVALALLTLRGERFTRLSVIRLFLGILGIYLLIGPGGRVNPRGVLLAIGAAFSWALNLALTQWRLGEYASQTAAIYVISLMTAMLGLFSLFTRRGWQSFPLAGWVVVLITGVVSTAVARLAMFVGIQRIGSGQTVLLAPVETILVMLWASLFLRERLSLVQWAGGLSILVSMALVARRGKVGRN
ncbi:MAG: DMT family transporter [Anaerolineae bacterium]|nr:MAG: DMT family transporter [Anaerolineae bacterium]